MTGDELRQSFLSFFEQHGHKVLPSASLVPQNDSSVLFTTAGMHPLVPYLLGVPHPEGRRLSDIQKCLRTGDIEEVGDKSHFTFFEMLGFWSLGDYWKADSLRWTLEWFTQEVGLERERISVTVFVGDEGAPRDEEAFQTWLALGIPEERIFLLPREDNWWGPVAETGLCGPDSELFYDTGLPRHGPDCRPGCACGKYLEIGNNVFLHYNKTREGTFEPLAQRNIDVGLGLERTLCVAQGRDDPYTTDLFIPIAVCLDKLIEKYQQTLRRPQQEEERIKRIILDHMRATTFIIADGVVPSNVERGYICRRLIRRVARFLHDLGIPAEEMVELVQSVIETYGQIYPDLVRKQEDVVNEVTKEQARFQRTLARGLREFARVEEQLRRKGESVVPGQKIFQLFDTYGFPPAMTAELASEHGLTVDLEGFERLFAQHQERSRRANRQRFVDGLAQSASNYQ